MQAPCAVQNLPGFPSGSAVQRPAGGNGSVALALDSIPGSALPYGPHAGPEGIPALLLPWICLAEPTLRSLEGDGSVCPFSSGWGS
jgi:hypothetical protein